MLPGRRTLVVLLAVCAACAADGSGDPTSTQSLTTTGKAPGDTSSTSNYFGNTTASGQVLTRSRKAASTPGGSDTLQTVPVVGAVLTLYHNVLQDGVGVSVFTARTASAVDGSYSFGPVPSGYYIIRSGDDGRWVAGVSYLHANAATVRQDIFVAALP